MRDGRFATPKFPQAARRSRAAEQRDELAPFHCPIPPVLPTERIAHLSYRRRLLRCGISIRPNDGLGSKRRSRLEPAVGRFSHYAKSERWREPRSALSTVPVNPCRPSVDRVNVLPAVLRYYQYKPIFLWCAASGPTRGCPRIAFQRQEGPAKPSAALLNSLEFAQQ